MSCRGDVIRKCYCTVITIYSTIVWCIISVNCLEHAVHLSYPCLWTSFRLQSVQGGLTCHEWADRRRCDLVRRVCAAEGSHHTPAPHEGVPGVVGHQRPWDPTGVQPADQWHHYYHGVPTGGQLHLHRQHGGGRVTARASMPSKKQTLLPEMATCLIADGNIMDNCI